MKPIILTASEVLAARDGTLTEIRRPVDMSAIDAVCRAWITRCEVDPDDNEAIFTSDRADLEYFRRGVACPLGAPGDVLFGQEAWRSWEYDCEDAGDEHRCDEHCNQTYVAYAATPRVGYRPIPDKARITYLDESTPLDRNRNLLGPWQPAETMPEWASRIRLINRGVRVERADVWMWRVAVEVTK